MTAIEIITVVTANWRRELTEERCTQAMREACFELWAAFNLGSDKEFELWWRFNME